MEKRPHGELDKENDDRLDMYVKEIQYKDGDEENGLGPNANDGFWLTFRRLTSTIVDVPHR